MPTPPIYPSNSTDAGYQNQNALMVGTSWPVKWTPVFFNQSQKALTGASIDIGFASSPLHQFELTYEVMRDFPGNTTYPARVYSYEFRRVLGFYMAMQGTLGRFLFDNQSDNLVVGQAIGTGDGITTTFQLVRTFGDASLGSSFAATEPIGYLNQSGLVATPFKVYLNGVAQSSATYTLSLAGANCTITFNTAPASGVAITADVPYYYYCKFADDSLETENFASGYWKVATVKLISCRAGA